MLKWILPLAAVLGLVSPALSATSSALEQARQQALSGQVAAEEPWRSLLHYRPQTFTGILASQADDARFFLSPAGKYDPEAELLASLALLIEGDAAERDAFTCRYPTRVRWLLQRFALQQPFSLAHCHELQQWLDEHQAESVTLVLAASYLNSPSSMFGHTFLRLNKPNQTEQDLILASTISYAADAAAHEGEFSFAFKGIFGGFPGITTTEPYHRKIKQYSHLENRDVWEYRLNLNAEELHLLLLHAWEVRNVRFDYYFFDENCAYRILSLIDIARPGTELVSDGSLYAIPAETVKWVKAKQLIDQVTYRPSQASTLTDKLARLNAAERRWVHQLGLQRTGVDALSNSGLSTERQAAVLETAYEWVRYRTQELELPREVTAELSLTLLQARSELASGFQFPPVPEPAVRDDQGHDTGRIAIGGGRQTDRNFVSLALRPAYHDISDIVAGYQLGAQLRFLDGEIRHFDDGDFEVDELTLIDILSISPRNRFFKPRSWTIATGVRRTYVESGDRTLAAYLDGGVGYAYDALRGRLYGLITGDFEIDDGIDLGFNAGPGVRLGWLYGGRWTSTLVEASYREFVLGDSHSRFQFQWGETVKLSHQVNVHLRYEYTRDFSFEDNALQGELRYYF